VALSSILEAGLREGTGEATVLDFRERFLIRLFWRVKQSSTPSRPESLKS